MAVAFCNYPQEVPRPLKSDFQGWGDTIGEPPAEPWYVLARAQRWIPKLRFFFLSLYLSFPLVLALSPFCFSSLSFAFVSVSPALSIDDLCLSLFSVFIVSLYLSPSRCIFSFSLCILFSFSLLFSPYLSHRQVLMGCPFGPPIDTWSTGVILLELLLGRPLFHTAGSRAALLTQIVCAFGPLPLRRFRVGRFYSEYFAHDQSIKVIM